MSWDIIVLNKTYKTQSFNKIKEDITLAKTFYHTEGDKYLKMLDQDR